MNLIELEIRCCKITTMGLLPVIEHCAQLRILDISGCKKVSLKCHSILLIIFNTLYKIAGSCYSVSQDSQLSRKSRSWLFYDVWNHTGSDEIGVRTVWYLFSSRNKVPVLAPIIGTRVLKQIIPEPPSKLDTNSRNYRGVTDIAYTNNPFSVPCIRF